jgi:hypothetical protein
MTIKRMLDGGGSSAARELLESALFDEPSQRALARTATSIGVAGAALTLSSAAKGAAMTGASTAVAGSAPAGVTTLLVAKWLLIGAVSGSAVSTAAVVATSPRSKAPAAVAAIEARATVAGDAPPMPPRVAPRAPEPPALSPPAAAQPAPQTRTLESAPTPEVRTETLPALPATSSVAPSPADQGSVLRDEVAMIDAVRAALASHDAATALSVLNRYDALVKTHVLDREARLLRIDALVQSGDRASAARLAQIYLNEHPNDPRAEHLRALSANGRGSAP